MAEPVRLIIWDLDDTFWRGTLIEGGVRAVAANHDLLAELSRRGIINSICVRGDIAPIRNLLRAFGAWDYFIFPSIDWSPRPPRIRALIESLRLPPSAVLLIDHNPAHRAAARALLPDLQVAGPDVLPTLLADERFAGRDDPDLDRLRQYKAMEQHGGDVALPVSDGGEDADFLRASGITVTIETDVAAHIDRAVALVNSVNPLNLTRNFLPAHLPTARGLLLAAIGHPHMRAGMLRVSDRHVDYGLCGFYLIEGAPPEAELRHFSLSCRVVGMGIETWLYEWIGRPGFGAGRDVPGQLAAADPVDWIGTDNAIPLRAQAHVPQIVVRGGHGMDWIADRCRLNSGDVSLEASRTEWHVLLNHDTTTNLALTLRAHAPEALAELQRIGFREPDLRSDFWTIAPGGIGIFDGGGDLLARRYQYRPLGIDFSFQINMLPQDFNAVSEQDILDFGEARGLIPETTDHVRKFVGYVAQVYKALPGAIGPEPLRKNLHAIFAAFPASATLFMLLPPTKAARGEQLYDAPGVADYRALVREVSAIYAHVTLIDVDEFVASVDDFESDGVRVGRSVHARIYQAIMARCGQQAALPAAA